MKHIKYYFCIATALFLVVLRASVVYSADFIDTFDDPSFTSSNWTTYATGAQQNWSHTTVSGSDSGYHASASGEDPIAAKLADNGVEYDNAGLVIETLVRLDSHPDIYTSENMVGVAFSVSQNTGYTAGIEQDYDGGTDILFSLGIVEGDAICEMPVDISFDTFYKLVVYMDSAMQINAWLLSSDDTLLGTLSMGNILSLQRGAVAIYGGPAVTFNNFKINDSGSIPSNRLTKTQVSQLYVSIFGRASEGEGNTYWQTQPDMATAAEAMLDTDAARNYFGANLNTNQAFIEHIYLNTLNKTISDDSAGINYWVNLLDTGTSRGAAVASLVGAINDYAPDGLYYNPDNIATVAAYNQFTNRVEVSDYMADNVWHTPDDWQTSTSFSHGLVVTDDPATVWGAKANVDLFQYAGQDPTPDQDLDGDGYSVSQGDCDDNNKNIYPGATETCGDGIDQDCNGSDLECSDGRLQCCECKYTCHFVNMYGSGTATVNKTIRGSNLDCEAECYDLSGNTDCVYIIDMEYAGTCR